MSVLIKGMKMPTSCADCWFEYAYEFCEGKYEDCPLIELPPHGRLIDAEALKLRVRGDPKSVAGIVDWIDQQPTIIPAEEGE